MKMFVNEEYCAYIRYYYEPITAGENTEGG